MKALLLLNLIFSLAIALCAEPANSIEKLSLIPAVKTPELCNTKKWLNPQVKVRSEAGVTINGLPTLIPLENLLDALSSLTASAWPYGRIILLNEVEALDGFRGDKKYLDRLHAILKSANIECYFPPCS